MASSQFGRVLVLGSLGMVGASIIRKIKDLGGATSLIGVCRSDVDLTDQAATYSYIAANKPDWVIVAAAKVGGILANNTLPKDFIYNNLAIQLNAIEGSYRAGVEKLIFLGSSCIYPRLADQPMTEEMLLSGSLEPTNEPYAIAKIAGIKLCESYNRQFGTDYRSLMPTNLYGPGDNYDPLGSHVIPGLIRRFHDAKVAGRPSVSVWGSGSARREFLHVDDLAGAVFHVMRLSKTKIDYSVSPMCSHLNVGSGSDLQISDLVQRIKGVTGFEGRIIYDDSKPDGAPRKLVNSSKLNALGWEPRITIDEGLAEAYRDFKTRNL